MYSLLVAISQRDSWSDKAVLGKQHHQCIPVVLHVTGREPTPKRKCGMSRITASGTLHLAQTCGALSTKRTAREQRTLSALTMHNLISSMPRRLVVTGARGASTCDLYTLLFSAQEQTHSTLDACDSEWVTTAFYSLTRLSTEIVCKLFGELFLFSVPKTKQNLK